MLSHLTLCDRIARHLWLGVVAVYMLGVLVLGIAIGVSAL